jgi:hypothetical protein
LLVSLLISISHRYEAPGLRLLHGTWKQKPMISVACTYLGVTRQNSGVNTSEEYQLFSITRQTVLQSVNTGMMCLKGEAARATKMHGGGSTASRPRLLIPGHTATPSNTQYSSDTRWAHSRSGHCKWETYLLPPEFEPRFLSHPARSLVTILTELLRLLLEVRKIKTERTTRIVFTLTEGWRILLRQSSMQPSANTTKVAEWWVTCYGACRSHGENVTVAVGRK